MNIDFIQEMKNISPLESTDNIIEISTVLNIPSTQAFEYFTKNELLEIWLTVRAGVEPVAGGKYELFWTPNDPDLTNNSTYGCKILVIDPPYYINFEWMGNSEQKHFMNNVRPLTNVTVIFIPLEANKTKVTLLHTGWRKGENWKAARQYFVKAWSMAFNKLERIIDGSAAN